MELGPVTYYFAVGKAAFPSSVNNAPPRPVGTGRPLDWWYDDMAGTLYTLVVEASGYKSTQKDLNLSVAMRYEVDANLQKEGVDSVDAGSAKPLLAPKAKDALDKALKALSSNKLSDAQKHLDEAVKLAPNHPDVLYAQGVLYIGRMARSHSSFTRTAKASEAPT